MTLSHPTLPMPEPLRGSDPDSFARHTVTQRLPNIGRRVFAENELTASAKRALHALLAEMPEGLLRPLSDPDAPDVPMWNEALDSYVNQNWLQAPWFVAETYFYRRIIAAVDYFHTGFDPFTHQKEEGLRTQSAEIKKLCQQLEKARETGWQPDIVEDLMVAALWGNQADLSLWSAGDSSMPGHENEDARRSHIVVNETTAVARHLNQQPQVRIDFILDNAGLELIGDVALADYLLSCGRAATVHLHAKMHPTFVSDATGGDILETLRFLTGQKDTAVRHLGKRMVGYIGDGRLQMHTHRFWTSPHPMWRIPDDLRQLLAPSALVISKGDANYRRCLGDAHWPYTTPFADIVNYFPAPLVTLRTCKSNVIAGLNNTQIQELNQTDADWITDGRWGVIQAVLS